MKKYILIIIIMLSALAANAQQRIRPMVVINRSTYAEVVDLVNIMARASFIEKMEGIALDANLVTTRGGEVVILKDGNSIKIIPVEFSKMLDSHIANPNRRWNNTETIRTELILQVSEMYNYIYDMLSGNRNIKNMYIKVDQRTGGAYIRIDFFKM